MAAVTIHVLVLLKLFRTVVRSKHLFLAAPVESMEAAVKTNKFIVFCLY